jgi:HK97 family phage prohead protease
MDPKQKEQKDTNGKNLILRIQHAAEIKVVNEEKGIVEAYVSIFGNIDSYGDIILRGAFLESLAKKLPKFVWSHNWEIPIGKILEAKEDDKGVYIKAQFNLETQRGKEAYSDLKFGSFDEFSIGLRVLDWEYDEAGHRVIKKAKLYEASPVLAGANPDTELISVKGDKDIEDKEEPTPPPSSTPGDGTETTPPAENASKTEEGSGAEVPPEVPEAPAVNEPKPDDQKDAVKQAEAILTKANEVITAINTLLPALEQAAGKKVDAQPDAIKIVRLKQAAKSIDKNAEAILRIIKQ